MLATLERGVEGGVWFSLIDKVYRASTLEAAWQRVRANKGAAGSDHQSISAFERDSASNLARLGEEIRTGRYCPRPIRRTYIDKPGSKEKRPLGIPAVRDRVVQTALCMVIEPILEREFVEHSYGFRPRRGCKDALREVVRLMKAGYTHVLDADIKAYFDSVPHEPLMAEVRKHMPAARWMDTAAIAEHPAQAQQAARYQPWIRSSALAKQVLSRTGAVQPCSSS
jgi:RNA-directed DNA polymerase